MQDNRVKKWEGIALPIQISKVKIKKQNESQSIKNKNEDGWVELQKPVPQLTPPKYVPKSEITRFLNIFKKLTVNIPFAKALEQIPSYAKFMKEIFSKEKKLEEFETIAMNEECIVVLQRKLPSKLKDLGRFIILCSIGQDFSSKTLCSQGASINLVSLFIYQRLGLAVVKPTTLKLKLADKSYIFPKGEIKNILLKVDMFIFLAYFKILNMEDKDVPIIMGKPFLATGRAFIDVAIGELITRVNNEQVVFNIFKAIEYHVSTNNYFVVNVIKKAITGMYKRRQ